MELELKGKKIRSGEKPLICVSLMGSDDAAIKKNLEEIIKSSETTTIDIVEFRGDFYEALEDADALSNILSFVRDRLDDKVLLFTIRSFREGGQERSYHTKSINKINEYVIENALSDMVDIELFSESEESVKLQNLVNLAKEKNVRIIMSNHDFEKTPPKKEMVSRLVRMQEIGADIAKLAVMPNSKADVVELLAATVEILEKYKKTPVVTMSMGAMGAISRVAGQVFGSAITFGAVGEVSAPGQIAVDKLNVMLEDIRIQCN